MDIERVVAQRLKDKTGIDAYLSVPVDPPDEFLTVEVIRTDVQSRFIPVYALDVDVWAKDAHARARAHELAQKVIDETPNLDEEPNIFNPTFENCYRSPDADTGRARYVVQIECAVCE